MYAYLYIELAKLGIDVIGESQLVGYPSQFPSVSMMDWTNGKPNARYWVLKLIRDNFHPGDKFVETKLGQDTSDIAAQGIITPSGKKLLLLNKRNRIVDVELPPGTQRVGVSAVDEATGDGPARVTEQSGSSLRLAPFSVAVVSWP